jgi:Tfp pilus assembly protein PilO
MRWLLPIILIGAAVAGFLLVTQPIYDEAMVLKAEADKYNEALSNSKILQAERDKLTDKFNSFSKEDIDRLGKIVPDSVDNIKLILEIQEVAQEKGILVKNVEFEPEQFIEKDPNAVVTETAKTTANKSANLRRPGAVDNLDYEIFDLEFSIEGKYGAFVDFMKLMERSLRVVDVKSISFTPGTSEDDKKVFSDNYKYTFRINTFRLKD